MYKGNGYNFKAAIVKPDETIAPNIDINKTIPTTIQDEIAIMILICFMNL